MNEIELNIVIEHVAYSLLSAVAAVILSVGMGWIFAKLTQLILNRSGRWSCALALFPGRAIVFSVAGASYLSAFGFMVYVIHFGFASYWVFFSTTIALTSIGAWIFASTLLHKYHPSIRTGNLFSFVRTIFVAAPWLCIRPGRLVGGGGLGSSEIGSATRLDIEGVSEAVLVVVLLAVTIDLLFGIGCFITALLNKKFNKKKSPH